MRFTISKKLIIGFLIVALFFGATSGIFYYNLSKVNNSYSDLINRRVNILNNAKDIQILAHQQTSSLRGYLLTESPEFITELQNANAEMNMLINKTSSLAIEPESKATVLKLGELNQNFNNKYEGLLMMFEENASKQAASEYFKTDVLPIGTQFSPLTKYLTERQQQLMNESRVENTEHVKQMKKMTIFFSVLALLLNILIGLIISKNITNNLTKITRVIKRLTTESNAVKQLPQIEVKSRDEIQDIAMAFNNMTQSLKEKSWLETSIAEMATMYQGIHDLQTLGQQFINKITPMIGANYGVFYARQGTVEQRFYTIAAYAFNGQEMGASSFRFGEGIVGQAALEKRTIHLTDIPENYIKIASGVGEAAPASIIVIPVEFEGEITVVIEIASFKKFTAIQETLLQQVANQIGITVKSVNGRMQVETLLIESKALTEELQSQSEELQLQHEELISMNEKLEEQYKRLEQKTNDLNNTKIELEEKALQLELNSKYKSEFLANMSHELRSPLNSLLILAHLLTENKEGNLTDQQVIFADTIYKSGNELLQLINEVLDLSKIESGKIDIFPNKVNLRDVCLFAERQFLQLANQKGLKLSISIEDNLPESIWTDQQRLQQVIRNLLSNAFKFTDKGEITMHIHKAKIDIHPAIHTIKTILAFSIKDTGIGISKEKQSLIFQAFQQGDGTTSRKYGGTGLGLSISREIAHLLGGSIDVESVPEKGSTFTLYLPVFEKNSLKETDPHRLEAATSLEIVDENKEQDITLQKEDSLLNGKKILIVDDDMRNIFAITTALESKQMTVVFAENGKNGINVLRQNPDVDIILMDIMMPEMDGYETIRTIRKMPEFEDLPIIALTAKAMKIDKDKCIEAGASDYISKPIFLDQLLSLIQVWLYR
ncbi:ATP-binding protein [Metabacillus sediminilitoris]|uniref:Circadian input-output histidine kinase CikA n=1 Tax=Metabacillus sediminilitoris TaxID=2567941 RepID=A0A4S4BVW1_9BACI|nr:ATP-binding protein [Metabacillus sediminilitoris]QGQ46252.1 response regulator [Metabacillus sediminilitoris]THF79304.1 response regulator [Metabacillus sediminilitoris]